MSELESAEEFVNKLDDCGYFKGRCRLIEADRAAARVELLERILGMRHAQVPYPLREWLQQERARYSPTSTEEPANVSTPTLPSSPK